MWAFPLFAVVVSVVFAALLLRQFLTRRRPYQLAWAVALLMFAGACAMVFLGVLRGWTPAEFKGYWLLGAVLTVPYLAYGEIELLARRRWVAAVALILLVFGTAFAVTRMRGAHVVPSALAPDLPSGNEAFANDEFVIALARYYSFPAYFLLVGGTLWSAWRMRSRRELRDRFIGTLAIAAGATVVAAGSAFAATGNAAGFSLTLAAGIAVMFWGFLRASRPAPSRREAPAA